MASTTRPKIQSRRKRKPKWLAMINECCTGCAGSPVCEDLCSVENCLVLVPDEQAAPDFRRMTVDPLRCIGCRKCISKGPDGTYLDGCPWGAIDMVDRKAFETEHGELPY